MTAPTTIAEDLGVELGSFESDIEAVLRASARPVLFDGFSGTDDRAKKVIALPPGWEASEIQPLPPRTAPDLQKGTYTALTAQGFVDLLDSLGGRAPERTCRFVADAATLTATVNPGTIDNPAFENLKAVLEPVVSDELNEWIQAKSAFDLDRWARWVEDHQADIEAAAEADDRAPGFLDVIQDARTWNVEARRAVRRIRTETGEADDVAEYKAEIVGAALASFRIRIPVLRFGEPVTLTVALTRDLDDMTIAARIPGVKRVIDAAVLTEITRAETSLEVDVIR